jgi:hypothetical protein
MRFFVFVPAFVLGIFGIVFVVAGQAQSPGDAAAARAYAADRSCAAALEGPIPAGACTVRRGTVDVIQPPMSTRGSALAARVTIRFGDGTLASADLAPRSDAFVRAVYPSDPALAQFFGGRMVRVQAHGETADTDVNPRFRTASDAMLGPVGFGLLAVAAALAWFLPRYVRRIVGGQ